MTEFIIRVLKWLAALVTAYFLLFFLIFLILIGIGLAFEEAPRKVEPNSILVLDLGFNLTDAPSDDDFDAILRDALAGEILETASLRTVLDTLEAARTDGDIHGLLLTGNLLSDGSGGSFAALREFRDTVVAFGRDKPVFAYLENESLRDYYLKSAATELIGNPNGTLDFRGLRAERLYLGDAFERIGIDLQVVAMEEYKTAWESFQESNMSAPEREQLQLLIDQLWASIVSDIGASRGLEPANLNSIAETELMLYADEIMEARLADLSLSRDELMERLAERVGYDIEGDTFKQFDFFEYSMQVDSLMTALSLGGPDNQLAILYMEGLLVDGESEDGIIGSQTLNRYLRELRRDDAVKAVVLRINSPGGSATASSKVLREIQLLNQEKPVVVSMGGIATSAGYMLSAAGDTIFTEPTTITGSIGVVVMLPNIAGLADKLSVNFEGVETHPFAGTYSLGRAKTPEEMRQIRAIAAEFYDEFVSSVAANRGLEKETVLGLAKGRVWSGTAALEYGLADEMGGLMAAVQRAADLAGIGSAYDIIERPRRLSLEEKISKYLIGAGIVRPAVRQSPMRTLFKDMEQEFTRLSALYDPHGQYAILPYTLKIN